MNVTISSASHSINLQAGDITDILEYDDAYADPNFGGSEDHDQLAHSIAQQIAGYVRMLERAQ